MTKHFPEFIYIADPLCSWCWGFEPVLKSLKEKFGGRADFKIMLGGLRPGDQSEEMTDRLAAMLKHHWQAVEQRSGQDFDYSTLDRRDFRYDTEPSCRAVVTARSMDQAKTYAYFWEIQRSFYAQGQDPTRQELFVRIAKHQGLDPVEFEKRYVSDEMKNLTLEDFVETRKMGVGGYPTVLLRLGKELLVLSRGYMEEEVLAPRLESWLEGVKTK